MRRVSVLRYELLPPGPWRAAFEFKVRKSPSDLLEACENPRRTVLPWGGQIASAADVDKLSPARKLTRPKDGDGKSELPQPSELPASFTAMTAELAKVRQQLENCAWTGVQRGRELQRIGRRIVHWIGPELEKLEPQPYRGPGSRGSFAFKPPATSKARLMQRRESEAEREERLVAE